MKLNKSRLTRQEYEKYLEIGEIDTSQNWLELFTPNVISDLFTIMDSSSNNQDKCDIIQEELEPYGFYPVGLGTNVYTVANPAYPGVCFKIALDTCGLADNFNDATLYGMVNSYLGKKRFTKVLARHMSGIVSVQERKVLMSSQDRIDSYRESILKALTKLSDKFLIVDLSPSEFHYNYGIERNGDWCFIDASDLYPLEKVKKPITCKMTMSSVEHPGKTDICGGHLVYNTDFSCVICEDCGRSYIPSDVRPKEKEGVEFKVNVTCDGMTRDEIDEMTKTEMVNITQSAQQALSSKNRVDSIPDGYNPNAIYGTQAIMNLKTQDPTAFQKAAEELRRTRGYVDTDPDLKQITTGVADGHDPDKGLVKDEGRKADVVETTGTAKAVVIKSAELYKQIKPNKAAAEPSEPLKEEKPSFIPPRNIAMKVHREPDSDDEEEIEEGVVHEVAREATVAYATSFNLTEDSEDDDDDDEDDTIQFIDQMTANASRHNIAIRDGEDIDDDDDEDPPPAMLMESDLDYSFIENEAYDGILISIKGDLNSVYQSKGLPIYVTIDGGDTVYLAASANDLLPKIAAAVKEAETDLGLLSK